MIINEIAEEAIQKAFEQFENDGTLTPHQTRIIQWFNAGFGCHACAAGTATKRVHPWQTKPASN